MNRTLTRGALSLLLALGACNGERPLPIEPDPDPDPGKTCTPALPALGPAPTASAPLRASPLAIPVLGQGVVSERFTSELWVRGAWAYTGTWGTRGPGNRGNALKVWNVSGNTPVLRDSVIVQGVGTLGDAQVTPDGRYLVVPTEGGASNAIIIYSLEDPAKPREVARHATAQTQTGVHTAELATVGGKLYAFLSVPSGARVVIVDLSTPTSPREVMTLQTGSPFTHDVFVRDGFLFTSGWNAGTTVWDIGGAKCGSPEKPVQVVTIPTVGGKVHNSWWYHDPVTGVKRYLFVGEEGPTSLGTASSGDIHVVDMSNLAAPREVAFYTVAGAGTHNFSVDEASGVLYAAYYNGGVRALDIRGDLGTCSADQKDSQGRCDLGKMGREVGRALLSGSPTQTSVWGVQLVGNHLYASDMLNGLWKLDVSGLKR